MRLMRAQESPAQHPEVDVLPYSLHRDPPDRHPRTGAPASCSVRFKGVHAELHVAPITRSNQRSAHRSCVFHFKVFVYCEPVC